jgi:hypothetical protein
MMIYIFHANEPPPPLNILHIRVIVWLVYPLRVSAEWHAFCWWMPRAITCSSSAFCSHFSLLEYFLVFRCYSTLRNTHLTTIHRQQRPPSAQQNSEDGKETATVIVTQDEVQKLTTLWKCLFIVHTSPFSLWSPVWRESIGTNEAIIWI